MPEQNSSTRAGETGSGIAYWQRPCGVRSRMIWRVWAVFKRWTMFISTVAPNSGRVVYPGGSFDEENTHERRQILMRLACRSRHGHRGNADRWDRCASRKGRSEEH